MKVSCEKHFLRVPTNVFAQRRFELAIHAITARVGYCIAIMVLPGIALVRVHTNFLFLRTEPRAETAHWCVGVTAAVCISITILVLHGTAGCETVLADLHFPIAMPPACQTITAWVGNCVAIVVSPSVALVRAHTDILHLGSETRTGTTHGCVGVATTICIGVTILMLHGTTGCETVLADLHVPIVVVPAGKTVTARSVPVTVPVEPSITLLR